MSYISFDHLADRFSDQIYGTPKGRIRQALLEWLYEQHLPELSQTDTLRVLDAGGGLGQMTGWLLEQGHNVDYFDVSTEMAARVSERFQAALEGGRLRIDVASMLDYQPSQPVDLVVMHAVLEWLEHPFQALEQARHWVRPGGILGLMVYNKHMLILRNLLRGTLAKVKNDQLGGDKRGLTPISPLDPAEIRTWLENAGFEIIIQAGIRTFTDLTEPTVLGWYDEEDVLNMEKHLCEHAPYRDMGRYVLFLARKSNPLALE